MRGGRSLREGGGREEEHKKSASHGLSMKLQVVSPQIAPKEAAPVSVYTPEQFQALKPR
jgi:hypothetical protein